MTLNEFIKTKADKDYIRTTIEYNGYVFRASYSRCFNRLRNKYDYEYNIFDNKGQLSVYSWEDDLPITVEKLETLMQYTIDDVPFCARCLEKIEGDGIRHFAGVYCKKCWTSQDQKIKDWDYSHLD